ncbi:PspC domain-containing protein [Ectothiorhodospiraceae bacterium BW-2]|nr:PspC domain-containing protein [Ectothiorhodospiraceae bacterium BW-2]
MIQLPLYRDRENRVLFGVCAGIATYLDINRIFLRTIWFFIGLVQPFFILLYFGLVLLLKSNPNALSRQRENEISLQQQREQISQATRQLQQIQQRVSALENCVTSDDFSIRSQLNR